MQRAQTSVQVLFFLIVLVFTDAKLHALDGNTADSVDPAEKLREQIFKLTPDEEKACRELFQKLADPDFETRDNAINRLLVRGPAVLKIAEEFYENKDPEIASAAKSLPGKFALSYQGYLPPAPSLLKALSETVPDTKERLPLGENPEENWAIIKKAIQTEGERGHFPILIDADARFQFQPGQALPADLGKTRGSLLQLLAVMSGNLTAIRGEVLVICGPDKAQKFATQAYTFKWKHLGYDRDEADRVGETLKTYFPAGTEVHASGEALTIRGNMECFPRAARLIALLEPNASAIFWPKLAPPGENTGNTELKLNTTRIAEHLQKPVSTSLNNDEPLLVIQDFRKQKADISLWADGREFTQPPYPREMRGLAPLSLKLKDTPLGLALRWLARRAAFAGANQKAQTLQSTVNDEGRVLLFVGDKSDFFFNKRVAGVDVKFVVPVGDKWGAAALDKEIAKILEEKLRPELELFPDFDWETDVKVLRGKLILQGNAPALLHALELITQWKKSGPPVCAWRDKLEEKLNREVDWNGQNQGAESLLPRLRQLGGVSLMIEPGPDGALPEFDLSKRQAELLWPGKYTFKALLNDLGKKAHAKWELKWGAVVLTPAAPDAPAQKEKEVAPAP